MSAVIEVEGLRKTYRRLGKANTVALDDLSFSVPEGGVFGFLGPNGSGKTTTIRCLLGLVSPDAGSTRLLGAAPGMLHTVIRRVGSMVETPTFFPTFSGRRNLRLLAAMNGFGNADVERALEKVKLADRAGDPFKNYSLGMKQRLGIAAALLKDPAILILDEPVNGLDPAGIKEVRDLLRDLGRSGHTVFLSSHLLGEVQQICDRVAILAKGSCVTTGPVGEVLASGHPTATTLVRAEPGARAAGALRAAGFDVVQGEGFLRVAGDVEGPAITKALADEGIYLSELRRESVDLESVFLTLTGEATQSCPACGSPVASDAKFCTTCGAPLAGEATS
ncbi:MAG TPA: ATP-binding cassette domain-containing protein [Actinomycetota bacterium]